MSGMRRCKPSARGLAVRKRLDSRLGDESGMALVMALGIMLVLTIVLTTVITFTAAGARDSHRVNAGQKASALAEAGLNNALAVLNHNYPSVDFYPGNPNLLPSRTTSYSSGSVTWSGTLEFAPGTATWKDEWRLTAVGSVPNPTGPGAAPVTRTLTAVVPIVIPESVSADTSTSSLNWVYAFHDVTFGQSVKVKSPVYSGRDLRLQNTAKISEVIPASDADPARLNRVAVGRDFITEQPGNQTGHVLSPPDALGADLAEVYVQGQCSSKNFPTPHSPCRWGADDKIWSLVTGSTIPPGIITIPKLTCCLPYAGSALVLATTKPEAVTTPATPSVLGFWYRNAFIGPNSLCVTSTGTPPRFDTPTGADGPDGIIDQSATASRPPFDLTGATYSCKTAKGELSYDAGTKKLTVEGSVFIDGSATSTAQGVQYRGKGAIILSGTFEMLNNTSLCVNLSGADCNVTAPWDPETAGLFIFAAGDFATELSTQRDATLADVGIGIKKGQFQGGLFAARNIEAIVSGTVVQGPMISAYANVSAGQSGDLSFPAISFPSSGTSGFTGPLPLPRLLPPRQFGGG
jgi:hypothetical protein